MAPCFFCFFLFAYVFQTVYKNMWVFWLAAVKITITNLILFQPLTFLPASETWESYFCWLDPRHWPKPHSVSVTLREIGPNKVSRAHHGSFPTGTHVNFKSKVSKIKNEAGLAFGEHKALRQITFPGWKKQHFQSFNPFQNLSSPPPPLWPVSHQLSWGSLS